MALIPWPEEEPEPTGEQLKEQGMVLALGRGGIEAWKEDFRATVDGLPTGMHFTSEDILERVGLPSGEVKRDGNNAVGALMNGMAKREIIRKAGYHTNSRRSMSHGAELTVWIKQ